MRIRGPAALARATALVGLTFLLAACGDQVGTASTDDLDLDGNWHLVEGRDGEGVLGLGQREVTLGFDDAAVGGSSGCNVYGAQVLVEGASVRFDEIGGTEMACEPHVMDLERRFLAVLGAVQAAEVDGGTLRLSGPDSELTFERDAAVDDTAFVGTTWTLESLIDGETASSVLPGGELSFTENGVVVGSSGCRTVRGSYEVHGDEVTVSELDIEDPLAGACPPGAEAQHRHVVDVLRNGFTAGIDGERLTLTSEKGLALQLRAR
ncbi:MAG TPA: META domain-containing protein [Nocardioidaceae bacterium]|nr:META domain-containing protein [Nocardioidaceae bacterium]